MRVNVGVAMPRKVLERGHHTPVLQAADIGRSKPRYNIRILAERAGVDNRVARVVVAVSHRREVHVHAKGARFERRDPPGLHRKGFVTRGAERHGAGKSRGPANPETDAGLEVGRVEQRERRLGLQSIVSGCGRQRLARNTARIAAAEQDVRGGQPAGEEQKTANVLFTHERHEPVVAVTVVTEVGGAERRHE